jgi:anhydro-N-acetylmuramic acid kinase
MTGVRTVAGCMTGTSIDALDAALVEIAGHGLAMRARFVRAVSLPLGDLAPRLRRTATNSPVTAGEIAAAARDLSLLHVRALGELFGAHAPDLVCVHGQTVFHAPPLSWQLMQPAPIAQAVGAPVVYDLRQADLARGGQGAPITPIADWVLFRNAPGRTAIINLGGFCNVTLLPPGRDDPGLVEAVDVCACNQLLDEVARRALGKPYDEDGAAAMSGTPATDALRDLTDLLRRQSRAGRSLGTGDELAGWVVDATAKLEPADLAATVCEAVAMTIAERVGPVQSAYLAGGGVRNVALAQALGRAIQGRVAITDELGIPPEYREAVCFAVLGALCQDRVPITLPRVTGCAAPAPVSGAWVFP